MKKHTFLIYAVLWLAVITLTFYQQMQEINSSSQDIAIKQAELLFQNVIELQQWYGQFESVYIPVTTLHQPNPDLTIPLRDIESSNGLTLTQIAPFCMNPRFNTSHLASSGIQLHLTSLNPLNPANQPDAWEASALATFLPNITPNFSLTNVNGETLYRYIQALPVASNCQICHKQLATLNEQNYGALSIAIPASQIDTQIAKRVAQLKVTYLFIALFSLVALFTAYLIHQKLNKRLVRAKQHLKLAYMDVLTQLPNRRYYDFFVNREWKRAMRQAYPISMIMIDIDYFKNYNDHFGHIQGDQCLQLVARTLRNYFRRAGDLIARYGGEEFCVVAACDAEQIKQLAEILKNAVVAMKLSHPGSDISEFVTISLGTATTIPTEQSTPQSLLKQADRALYLAKQRGKNRVESGLI